MFSQELGNSERRRLPRVDFREPVRLQISDSPLSRGSLARNISEGGLRINFEHFVKPQELLGIEFRLSDDQPMMVFEGRVAWVSQIPLSDRYQLGIQFTSTSEDGQMNIHKYVTLNKEI